MGKKETKNGEKRILIFTSSILGQDDRQTYKCCCCNGCCKGGLHIVRVGGEVSEMGCVRVGGKGGNEWGCRGDCKSKDFRSPRFTVMDTIAEPVQCMVKGYVGYTAENLGGGCEWRWFTATKGREWVPGELFGCARPPANSPHYPSFTWPAPPKMDSVIPTEAKKAE